MKDESLEDGNELPESQDMTAEAITELEVVVDDLREIIRLIEIIQGGRGFLTKSSIMMILRNTK